MKLRWYKGLAIALIIASASMGWLALSFPRTLIRPFPLAPLVEIEFYNYVAGIARIIEPVLLFAVILLDQWFAKKLIFDRAVTKFAKITTLAISIFAIAGLVNKVKELFDFILFYNVMPDNANYFWFIFGWEFIPFAALFLFASWKSKIP